jgi:hypothetical protein
MLIMHSVKTQILDSQELLIDCPKCATQDSVAVAYDEVSILQLFGFIPVFQKTNTWVKCESCNSRLYSTQQALILSRLTPSELKPYVRRHLSIVWKVLTIAALLLCFVPFLGLGVAALAFMGTYQHGGAWRTTAIVATGISVVVSAIMGISMATT